MSRCAHLNNLHFFIHFMYSFGRLIAGRILVADLGSHLPGSQFCVVTGTTWNALKLN